MMPDAKVRAVARPLRIAYVLEDGPDSGVWLNSIFATCFSRDGGRQSLVVPVIDGVIVTGYLNWLTQIDPDYVVLVTYENLAHAGTIVRVLSDTIIEQVPRSRGEVAGNHGVGGRERALTSISQLPYLNKNTSFRQKAPELFLDKYPQWVDDGFVQDNFGTLFGSINVFPRDQQLGIKRVLLTPSDAPENRWNFPRGNSIEVPDGYAVIDMMAAGTQVANVATLSNMADPQYEVQHRWGGAFSLIVGDGFADRIAAWNAALLCDYHSHQTYQSLRIPRCVIDDEAKTKSIAAFLRKFNFLGHQNGIPSVAIRSLTLAGRELDMFTEGIQEGSRSVVALQPTETLESICPADDAFNRSRWRFDRPTRAATDAPIRDEVFAIQTPRPRHLDYCVGESPIFSEGTWMVDLLVDRTSQDTQYSNVREVWKLPPRTNLTRLFVDSKFSRITADGLPSCVADLALTSFDVKQPTDENLFKVLLNNDERFNYDDLRKRFETNIAYKYSEPSDKGRYLQGFLGVFGSLSYAHHVIDNHFWREQLLRMATPADSQIGEIVQTLQKRMNIRTDDYHFQNRGDWEDLAGAVVGMASKLKRPNHAARFDTLLTAWQSELSDAIDGDPNLASERDEHMAHASDELIYSLTGLVEHGVFFRGHQWSCRHCAHRNWAAIDGLANHLSCEVCQDSYFLPIRFTPEFRLSEFVSNCLRDHDTASVTWGLAELRRSARVSFIFSTQTALFTDFPTKKHEKPDRELDILCLLDGKLVVGESKVDAARIKDSDINDLAELAKALRADIAVLSATSGDDGLLDRKLERLRSLLPATIEVRKQLAGWDKATPTSIL